MAPSHPRRRRPPAPSRDTGSAPGRWLHSPLVTSAAWHRWHLLTLGHIAVFGVVGLLSMTMAPEGGWLQAGQVYWAGAAGVWVTERLIILLYGVPLLRTALAPWGVFGSPIGSFLLALGLVFMGPLGINFAGASAGMGAWWPLLIWPGLACTLPLAIILWHPRALWRGATSLRGDLAPLGWRLATRILKMCTFFWLWGPLVRRRSHS